MADIDPVLQALLLKTIQVQQKGALAASRPALTLEKEYNTRYILQIARSMSLPEITALLRASAIREKGLALIKAGDATKGAEFLREARRIFSEAALSKEAFVSADSFQYAAEAYLEYKKGDYAQAEASLLQAIILCHVLRDRYEHQVEVRRIHLARNIVRVKSLVGNREEALRMASLLVGYVEGDRTQWPLRELSMTAAPDPLLAKERWALMDQVLGEIAMLATRRVPTSHELLSGSAGWLFLSGSKAAGEFARVHAWLAARRASIEGDARGFLTHGIIFFAEGANYLRRAWRELSLDLMDLCKEIASEQLGETNRPLRYSLKGEPNLPMLFPAP
jgi:tetratricopeptide (TPR) repeat protein